MDQQHRPHLVVQVIRTGGFAGLRRQWEVAANSADEAKDWWALVEACPWDAAPGECRPDGFVYEVRANDLEATLPEQEIDGPWKDLVEAVVDNAS